MEAGRMSAATVEVGVGPVAPEGVVAVARAAVEELALTPVPAYGASTGFGALATRHIATELREQLQKSAHDAEDVVQETYLRAWRGYTEFETGHRCGHGSTDRDQRLPDRARAQQPAHAAVGPWRSGRRSVRRAGARAGGGVALELARRQGATFFELRAAVDDFDLRGEPARAALVDAASRIPTDSRPPELARARAALESTTPQLG
jgi:aromatic amino acid lyase/sigma-70-like protein